MRPTHSLTLKGGEQWRPTDEEWAMLCTLYPADELLSVYNSLAVASREYPPSKLRAKPMAWIRRCMRMHKEDPCAMLRSHYGNVYLKNDALSVLLKRYGANVIIDLFDTLKANGEAIDSNSVSAALKPVPDGYGGWIKKAPPITNESKTTTIRVIKERMNA